MMSQTNGSWRGLYKVGRESAQYTNRVNFYNCMHHGQLEVCGEYIESDQKPGRYTNQVNSSNYIYISYWCMHRHHVSFHKLFLLRHTLSVLQCILGKCGDCGVVPAPDKKIYLVAITITS